jgi:predicted ester cyclase
MGTPEENKALVLRFIDALDTGDVATAAACFDADRYYSNAMEADLAGTWEQMKARRREPSFADVENETIALVAEGDRVAYHTRMTATHVGELLGIPASGARVTFDSLQVWRIDGDKIVEHWGGPIVTEKVAAALRGR